MGVALISDADIEIHEMYRRADEALYQVKREKKIVLKYMKRKKMDSQISLDKELKIYMQTIRFLDDSTDDYFYLYDLIMIEFILQKKFVRSILLFQRKVVFHFQNGVRLYTQRT